MTALIPAINAETFEEVVRRIRMLEPLAEKFGFNTVHLDVADGTFTENTIWHDARELVGFETPLAIEAHLMLAEIDMRLEGWLFDPMTRIIFHKEAAHDPSFVIQKCRDAKIGVGIAVRPETDWKVTKPYWSAVDCVQLLSVIPGRAGQAIQEGTTDKLRALRAACPSCTIEVDGGVSARNAKELKDAGADWLVAASAIFDAPDVEGAIANLTQAVS
ncbi:MAG: hypothetical protein HYS44_02520 [Candidatus Niyogibacteria bacterium]|nr:hypothetical protein [Candidatus Niyogibacteria bacterium]